MVKNRLKNRKSNKIIVTLILTIILICSAGVIYADVGKKVTSKTIDFNKLHQSLPHGQISEELRQKLLADLPHSSNSDISISDKEKIEISKKGFSFDEIDAAVRLANDKKVTDIMDLLKNHKEEVKTLKDKLEKAPVKDIKDMINEEKMKELNTKGYSKSDVNLAYYASQKLNITFDEALKSIQSRDPNFINKIIDNNKEVRNNEN